jgi:hemoglobin-like flavoprotein
MDSFEAVGWENARFAPRFYELLFEAAPEARALFAEDMSAQEKKLFSTLATVVRSLHNLESLVPTLQELGRSHAGMGVTEDQYALVENALLATLAETVPDWSKADMMAWATLYGIAADVMMQAGRDAAGPRAIPA